MPLCVQDNRFENCHPLRFTCKNDSCKAEIEIKTTLTEVVSYFYCKSRIALLNDILIGKSLQDGVIRPSLAMCSNPECHMAPWKYAYAIQNRVQLNIRKFVSDYYYGEVECENPICSKVMRRITMDTTGTHPKCYGCLDGSVHRIVS